VRRGSKVHGPFTGSQITGGLKVGKLSLSDEIGTQQDGPWSALQQIAQQLSTDSQPVPAIVKPAPEAIAPASPESPQSASNECWLSVRRDTGVMGRGNKLKVWMDGEVIATLARNETFQSQITPGRHLIEVRFATPVDGWIEKSSMADRGRIKHNVLAAPSSSIDLVIKHGALCLVIEECASGGTSPPASTAPNDCVFILEGVQDVLEVYGDHLTITPKGVLGFLNKGLKGTKDIPYASITAVQLREANGLLSGFIQFSILGGSESRGGMLSASRDENSVMFARTEDNEKVRKIKAFVDEALRALRQPQLSTSAALSIAAEIQQLANLKEQGVISEEEFLRAKQKLLGG
jgi:hypothetical protein